MVVEPAKTKAVNNANVFPLIPTYPMLADCQPGPERRFRLHHCICLWTTGTRRQGSGSHRCRIPASPGNLSLRNSLGKNTYSHSYGDHRAWWRTLSSICDWWNTRRTSLNSLKHMIRLDLDSLIKTIYIFISTLKPNLNCNRFQSLQSMLIWFLPGSYLFTTYLFH